MALTLALVAAAVLAAAVPTTAAAATGQVAFGLYSPGANNSSSALDAATTKAGRAPAIVNYFRSWSDQIAYSSELANIDAHGALPLITWEPDGRPLTQITAGAYDSYIRDSARTLAAWDKPLFVRFAHEMNGDWTAWGTDGNTAAEYKAAWRHVVAIFRQEGADKVRFVFSPNVDDNGKLPFESLYPGDEWVDWVALDGYNFGTDGEGWQSFTRVFASSYRAMNALTDKPLMIAETGSSEDGGNKAAWIRSALREELPNTFPEVRAVLFFDQDFSGVESPLDSSAGALSAFRDAISAATYGLDAAGLLAAESSAPVDPPPSTDPGAGCITPLGARARGGSIRVKVRCAGEATGSCTSALKLKRRGSGTVIGRSSVQIGAGSTSTVRLKVRPSARAALSRELERKGRVKALAVFSRRQGSACAGPQQAALVVRPG